MIEQAAKKTFLLHIRCSNCRKDFARKLAVPRTDDAPSDIDELLESQFLAQQRFACTQCESIIGQITAVTMPREPIAA